MPYVIATLLYKIFGIYVGLVTASNGIPKLVMETLPDGAF